MMGRSQWMCKLWEDQSVYVHDGEITRLQVLTNSQQNNVSTLSIECLCYYVTHC